MNAELLPAFATWAWRTSIEALPLAIAALVFWRWMPVTWRWWLPALLFLRLALPQVPETGWHWRVIAEPPSPPAIALASRALDDSPANAAHTGTPSYVARAKGVLPVVWGGGVVLVAAWLALSQWRLRRSMRTATADDALQAHCDWAAVRMEVSRRVPIHVVRGLPTMAVSGCFHPALLVPGDLTQRFTIAQIRGMMLHEMAHVRRRDVLWTWLALSLCALHWFNPLVWIALRRFHADRELACDAAALRALDQSARHEYGEALLLCLHTSPRGLAPALVPFFRHFSELKQRLQHIMNPASPSMIKRLATLTGVASLVAFTFTAARAETREGDASKTVDRLVAAPQDGEAKKEGQREGEPKKEGARDGEAKKDAPRDGEQKKAGPRDGEAKKEGARDGEVKKEGARDGEAKKEGARDGEAKKEGQRDGEAKKEGARDGERKKEGPRDGEAKKEGARDGDAKKGDAREGEKARDDAAPVKKTGTGVLILNPGSFEGEPAKARDGEGKKAGPRDGEQKKEGARDGER